MASELVKVVWCTKCGRDKPATHSEVFQIGALRKTDDMCTECWDALVTPLVEHLKAFGTSPADFEETPTAVTTVRKKTKNEPRYFCSCGEGFVHKSNMDNHKRTKHGIIEVTPKAAAPKHVSPPATEPFDKVPEPNEKGEIICPLCPEEGPYTTKQGFKGHMRSNVHLAHFGLTA